MATIEVHKFIEGPFELGDDSWYNLCLALLPCGGWVEIEMYYSDFNAAYKDSTNLNRSPYPLEVDDGCLTTNLN